MRNSQSQYDIETIKRFKEKANELCNEKYIPLHKQLISISLKEGLGKITSEFPNEMIVDSFLMQLRFFIIEKQNKFNFEKVCEFFINNNFESERVSQWLDVFRRLFTEERVGLNVNKKDLTIKIIFHTILNEDHFHQEKDQKGMKVIKSSPFVESFAKMKFFDVLGKLHLVICNFNKQIVKKYLNQYAN